MPRFRPARRSSSRVLSVSAAFGALALALSCSSDGGTPPVTVSSVVITAPATGPSFQTLGRTVQFAAEPRNSANAPIAGLTTTWSSSAGTVASASATGLVTALLNGTTEIRATVNGVQSPALVVTVTQFADTTVVTPAAVAFGAIGSTRQLTALNRDSSGAAIPGTPTVTYTRAGGGLTATVSATGLVTALAVGASDTAVATAGANVTRAPISVTQVPASILVTSNGSDTIRTTGVTRTFSAAVRDSQANVFVGPVVSWSSLTPGVASVASNGIATAIADGETNIRATLGAVTGQRLLTVRRYAAVFDLAPLNATITTNGGTQPFTINARDSTNAVLAASWLSRLTSIATVAPATGAAATVSASGNGMTFIIVSAGTRTDSAQVTVSGQVAVAVTAAVSVGNFFFRSVNNLTENMAIDTVAVGGTVTWTWLSGGSHNVESIATPNFTSSAIQNTGTVQRTFNAGGTYQYQCIIHSLMTGRIVVR